MRSGADTSLQLYALKQAKLQWLALQQDLAEHESVDVAVETGLREFVAGQRIAFIESCGLPAEPELEGFFPLPELADYIAWRSMRADV
jgi:hypothetical protein